MRLQRLEISGFKSFSDRAEFSFDRGVTAIVGPNGCGKSNIADAIVWVLGEQSAKSLRGDRMEDVIFNGSDARKPTATAEVRLLLGGVTLPPRDRRTGPGNGKGGNGHGVAAIQLGLAEDIAREVEVTRRLYRSGESEYLINGEICRLRDLHDLFMDTGLGAKAYAVIEQGRIGMILSGRPADRRQLIEEAAGVTKYRSRRRAAELKLEAARQNLTRIDDIAFEVEKQRGALKRQAAKARRYRRLREDLRRWEKIQFARRHRVLAEIAQTTRTRLVDARMQEALAAARLAELDGGLERLRLELARGESGASAVREQAHAREIEIDRRQGQLALGAQQVEALSARAAEISDEVRQLEVRREPARASLVAQRAAAERVNTERDEAAAAMDAAGAQHVTAREQLSGLESDVEAARTRVFVAMNAAMTLRHAVDHAAVARNRVVGDLSRLDAESSDLELEATRVSAERTAAAAALRRIQDEVEQTRVTRVARESELASVRIEHEWRTREVRARERDLSAAAARLGSLEELAAARADYGDAARRILAESGGRIEHMGSVADHLDVERDYERAVEGCLGDLLEHVVVRRVEDAAAGLDYLRQEHAGRCGFLVASGDVQPAPRDPADVEQAPPGLIPLDSVLRVTGPFASAIRVAIGSAWIAPSFDEAARAAGTIPHPVVTLAGDVFHGAARVFGGGVHEARGILGTKREVRDLQDRVASEQAGLRQLSDEVSALEASMGQVAQALAALGAEQHQQEKTMVQLEAQHARVLETGDRLGQRAELLNTERRRADEERRDLERREQEAHESIRRLETEQAEAEEGLAVAQRRLFEAREAVEQLSRRAAEAKVAHVALIERSAAMAAEANRLDEAARELEARLAGQAEELRHVHLKREEVRAAMAETTRLLDADSTALEELRAAVRAADEQLADLRGQVDSRESEIRDARRVCDQIRTTVNDLAVASATAEADLAHLATSCLEALQCSLEETLRDAETLDGDGLAAEAHTALAAEAGEEEFEEAADTGGSPASVSEPMRGAAVVAKTVMSAPDRQVAPEDIIAGLRAKIDALGAVNMMAIEQFDELQQRHEFLTVQRKDLVESIAATGEAIRRIDETTKERFRHAFTAINANFQETFTSLFGGGSAALTLLDETDVLESGIEIIAQPPGKRLQNVQLLSGGEKALTAIALMFAVFRYKPGPFCVLDEIDAPLDDANIGRFVEMVRRMQEETQFILITHNRKTMEIADWLYGVTMEEPGVSKLISVKLH